MKRWLNLDDEIEEIQNSDRYFELNLGIQSVNPTHIVALSRKLDQTRLETLREKIKTHGWQDLTPFDLELILMPDQKRYAVSSGGNHRAYLSNEFGIERIEADVVTYLAKSELTNEQIYYVDKLQIEKSDLYKSFRKLRSSKLKVGRLDITTRINDIDKEITDYLRKIYWKL